MVTLPYTKSPSVAEVLLSIVSTHPLLIGEIHTLFLRIVKSFPRVSRSQSNPKLESLRLQYQEKYQQELRMDVGDSSHSKRSIMSKLGVIPPLTLKKKIQFSSEPQYE